MATSDAQKSEVHDTSADASTSPIAGGDTETTRHPGQDASTQSKKQHHPQRQPERLTPDTTIVTDDTDVGGPLVVQSGDPDLNPPQTPKDPFPTMRTPEIDPPVEQRKP